jgi:ATP/ADP translocase
LFTVIGAGGILGATVGGSFTGFFGPRIGAASVLSVAAGLLFGGSWIARAITKGKRQDLTSPSLEKDKAPILESAHLVRFNRYLLLIALAVIASTVVGTLVRHQFKAVAQAYFEAGRDGLASFAGYFYGYVSVISFLFHATLSTRILRWIGPSFALFVPPLAMLSGVVGLLFSASIFAAIWARGADQGFRHSIDRASSELLWVSVASDLRNRVKSSVDIVVSRGADGLASLILIALLYIGDVTIQHISWASLIFLLAWLLVLWTLRGKYIQTLRTTIERRDISAEQLLQRLAASGPSNELETGLASSDAQDVEVAVRLAQFSNTKAAQSQLASLLVHES